EPLQARLARGDHEVGPAVGELAALAAKIAEFGRQHDFAAAVLDSLADQCLVVAGAIGVRRVEQVDAAVERLVDDGDAVVVIAGAVGAGQRHAAEPDRRDTDARAAERALCNLLFRHIPSPSRASRRTACRCILLAITYWHSAE